MKIISHRGYENGEDPFLENNPKQIKKLLNMNIDVEIDVLYNGAFYLGHDEPLYEVELDFLKQDGLWCHAKNIEALELMLKNDIHCFWHQTDELTLTSKGIIWAFPGVETSGKNTVFLFPERFLTCNYKKYEFVCTDYITLCNTNNLTNLR